MLANGAGSIVNIASMSGTIVNRGLTQAHYNASKAGVIHLSRSLAMEWSARGVRVNSISPGYTATPMNTRPEVAEQVRRFEADTPLGRMADPEEMAGLAVFLLSPASAFCTGIDLVVDGGFTCWYDHGIADPVPAPLVTSQNLVKDTCIPENLPSAWFVRVCGIPMNFNS